MHDFITRLIQITRKELLYVEGFLCMHHERYAEYERDLKLARAQDDTARAEEIEEDLCAFRGEIAYLERKQATAYERLQTLVRDERFATVGEASGRDTARTIRDTTNITRLNGR